MSNYLVTGGTSGVGRASAKALVASGHHVIVVGRNQQRGEQVAQELGIPFFSADLSTGAGVDAVLDYVVTSFDKLDGLLNNAGMFPRKRRVTSEGVELTFATNVLSYFRLTKGLLPLLRKAKQPRIVDVASSMIGDYEFSDLQFESRKWNSISAYKQSKQCNRMLAWAWARKLQHVTINAVHPGMVATNIQNNQGFPLRQVMRVWWKLKGISAEEGAITPVWALTNESLANTTGKMFARQKERSRPHDHMEKCDELWDYCEGLDASSRECYQEL